ncbi:MAG: formaldehyde-activating enzyme [Gammaproteobacteria bacterium]|nr:MAG: formaldehyde-activating enzyme [Gammaproteobacteria bacterium]
MRDVPTFRTGEATVFASHDQGTDAMPEVVLGAVNGPVGTAFATLMGQTEGHTRLFAIRACNQQVKPATLMVPKVTMEHSAYINLFFGVVQSAIADAVLDCVIEGVIPRAWASEICIIVNVWLDPECAAQESPDKKDLYRTNYEATKLAIRRALNDEPSIEELIANRHQVHHEMYDPVTGESKW